MIDRAGMTSGAVVLVPPCRFVTCVMRYRCNTGAYETRFSWSHADSIPVAGRGRMGPPVKRPNSTPAEWWLDRGKAQYLVAQTRQRMAP